MIMEYDPTILAARAELEAARVRRQNAAAAVEAARERLALADIASNRAYLGRAQKDLRAAVEAVAQAEAKVRAVEREVTDERRAAEEARRRAMVANAEANAAEVRAYLADVRAWATTLLEGGSDLEERGRALRRRVYAWPGQVPVLDEHKPYYQARRAMEFLVPVFRVPAGMESKKESSDAEAR